MKPVNQNGDYRNMELQRQRDLETSFFVWFNSGLKKTIDDNRRRYRMEMADAEERIKHSLSVLPSVKSTTIVDSAVDRAIQEYHQDPDAQSFTAKVKGDIAKEQQCRWLTEIVKYRMRRTFRYFTWHRKSIKAGFTDGIEAALVSWKHATKKKTTRIYSFTDSTGQIQPTSKEDYDKYNKLIEGYSYEDVKSDYVVSDTWWIDQLMPGRDVIWDMKAPLMDVNLGQFCLVKLSMSLEDVKNQQKNKVFNAISDEMLEKYQKIGISAHSDLTTTARNPEQIDLSDLNHLQVWVFFDREDNDWGVQFSLEGKEALSTRKPVNDVFFNGREVNRLPVVIGYSDDELWENVGRGLPKIIAPLEDEASDHRNNFNDYAKQLLRGRHWVDPSSDVDIDQLVNMPVVYGREGTDFGQIKLPQGSLEVLRATDSIDGSMNALVPVEISGSGRNVAPKGTNATLGTVQMAQGQADGKMGVRLMTRNETFLLPVLYLIAQMEFAWETDETIARYAADRVNKMQPPPQDPEAPQMPPFAPPQDGGMVDFRGLDFDFDVQINAGLGAVSLQQKAASLVQVSDWRRANNLPTDVNEIARQLNVLTGFDADAFTPAQMPPPQKPPVEYKATVNIDLNELLRLAPQAGQFLMEKMMNGGMNVTAAIKDNSAQTNEQKQNGGGIYSPNRTGQQVSGTDAAAQRMSEGGQHSPNENRQ